jgi:hypothetical protein
MYSSRLSISFCSGRKTFFEARNAGRAFPASSLATVSHADRLSRSSGLRRI